MLEGSDEPSSREWTARLGARQLQVSVPDLGDFAEVPVIEVLVSAGDTVEVEDPLIVLESEKATMEVPCPAAGTVNEVIVSVGDRVSEGFPILVMEPTSISQDASPRDSWTVPGEIAPSLRSGTEGQSIVRVPDIAGFTVPVIEVLVSAGDEVVEEDPLVVLESDKATMEIPAPSAGRVETVLVSIGSEVSEGSPIVVLERPVAEGDALGDAHLSRWVPPSRPGTVATPPAGIQESFQVRVPDIGEFQGVPIIEVLVEAGDAVREEDPLVVLESEKATMEVPSPSSGLVQTVLVAVGDTVSEGSLILVLRPAQI